MGVTGTGDGEIVDALPRADVDAPFAQDALGLIDVEKLLGAEFVLEVLAVHQRQLVVVPKGRGLVDDASRHQASFLTSGRP